MVWFRRVRAEKPRLRYALRFPSLILQASVIVGDYPLLTSETLPADQGRPAHPVAVAGPECECFPVYLASTVPGTASCHAVVRVALRRSLFQASSGETG